MRRPEMSRLPTSGRPAVVFSRRVGRIDGVETHFHCFLRAVVGTTGRYECAFGSVEVIEKPLVERKSGTQNGGDDHVLCRQVHLGGVDRCLYGLRNIGKCFAYFICHDLSHSFEISPEPHTVVLEFYVSDFVEKGIQ